MMKPVLSLLIGVGLFLTPLMLARDAVADDLTVVELFTSEACPKCIPAHPILADLDALDDVLVLSWPVNIWDYLDWKDTMARPEHSVRQEAYAEAMGRRGVFTPQMIFDGRVQSVGAKRDVVMATLKEIRSMPLTGPTITVRAAPDAYQILIDDLAIDAPATVMLVWFDTTRQVKIRTGYNRGKVLSYTNVVRGAREVAKWHGAELAVVIDAALIRDLGCDGAAILVQQGEGGPILAAARLPLDETGGAGD